MGKTRNKNFEKTGLGKFNEEVKKVQDAGGTKKGKKWELVKVDAIVPKISREEAIRIVKAKNRKK